MYITKAMRLNGGCVLAPYQITRGSLPSITMSVNGSGVLVSGLSIGSLQIGAQTTVAELSQAIIGNNVGWQVGDQLTFFLGRQMVDAVTNIPRATLTANKVVMNPNDETLLLNIVSADGFSSVDGKLGMNAVLLAGAAAWVHSREAGQGQLKVSTQFFYVENAALASYQTSAALMASANSYGGINTGGVYLLPSVANGISQSGGTTSGGTTEPSGGGTTGGNTGGVTPSDPSTGDNTGGGNDNPPAGDGSGDED